MIRPGHLEVEEGDTIVINWLLITDHWGKGLEIDPCPERSGKVFVCQSHLGTSHWSEWVLPLHTWEDLIFKLLNQGISLSFFLDLLVLLGFLLQGVCSRASALTHMAHKLCGPHTQWIVISLMLCQTQLHHGKETMNSGFAFRSDRSLTAPFPQLV